MCAEKFPLVSMGGRAEGLACADPGARTPIGASGNLVINLFLVVVVVVVHATVVADRIMVLKDGKILEMGTHEELLANETLYAELFNLQAEGYA